MSFGLGDLYDGLKGYAGKAYNGVTDFFSTGNGGNGYDLSNISGWGAAAKDFAPAA